MECVCARVVGRDGGMAYSDGAEAYSHDCIYSCRVLWVGWDRMSPMRRARACRVDRAARAASIGGTSAAWSHEQRAVVQRAAAERSHRGKYMGSDKS